MGDVHAGVGDDVGRGDGRDDSRCCEKGDGDGGGDMGDIGDDGGAGGADDVSGTGGRSGTSDENHLPNHSDGKGEHRCSLPVSFLLGTWAMGTKKRHRTRNAKKKNGNPAPQNSNAITDSL